MLFTLEPLPAAEGDCLLLHWGTAANPHLAVIDGGPGRIYDDHLRPRLEQIAANRNVPRLPLELVMISHVDNDHIVGVKKLVRALKEEVDQHIPVQNRAFEMKRLWHNAFNDILGDAIDTYYGTMTASFHASVGGRPNPTVIDKLADAFRQRQGESPAEAQHDAWDVALLLAGHAEGRQVRIDHQFLFNAQETAALNSPFRNAQGRPTLITAELTPAPVDVAGLEFKIVGPMGAEIQALQREFDAYLKTANITPEAVLAAYADKSVKNLSSIVCLVGFGGKRILLTGDARGDKILAGLGNAGLLDAKGGLTVEVLKVPHHGSGRNVEPGFFKRIVAKTYVFSGDGKHGNPDRETFEWLAAARGQNARYRIVLTYRIAAIDAERKRDFQEHNRPWNQEKDSLTAFFRNAAASGYKFSVHEGAPEKIDLGNEKVKW